MDEASRRRSFRSNQVVVSGFAESAGELLRHARGLVLATNEASDAATGHAGLSGEIDHLPALRGDVLRHSSAVPASSQHREPKITPGQLTMSTAKCSEGLHAGACQLTMLSGVGRARVHKDLGREIASLRGKLSQERFAKKAGIAASTLKALELGVIKRPRPGLLVRIAERAGRPPDYLVQKFARVQYPDLFPVTSPVPPPGSESNPSGGSDVFPASARILELESMLAERDKAIEHYEAQAREVEPIVRKLFDLFVGDETDAVTGKKTTRRRAHRKTG